MNEITIFKNEKFGEVRTVEINNECWFVAKDVAEVLGYTNPTKAIKDHIDKEDMSFNESLKLSRQSGAWIINESGLYSLIISSKLESAKDFKHWITSEVLPSIRKHGLFAMNEVLDNPDLLINALTELKKEREQKKLLESKNKQLEHALEYDKLVGWFAWKPLKKEIGYRGSFEKLANELGLIEGDDFERKVMGMDKFPTIMISPEAVDKICVEA